MTRSPAWPLLGRVLRIAAQKLNATTHSGIWGGRDIRDGWGGTDGDGLWVLAALLKTG